MNADTIFIIFSQPMGQWKSCLQGKGLKVNVSKTKVMMSGGACNETVTSGKYPCSVYGKIVGSNSIMCKECEKWVHRKCSGIKGSLIIATGKFVCKRCQAPSATSVAGKLDMGDGSEIEVVEKFCYLGDMESTSGTAELAVTRMWANAQRDGRPAKYRWRPLRKFCMSIPGTMPQTLADARRSSAAQ